MGEGHGQLNKHEWLWQGQKAVLRYGNLTTVVKMLNVTQSEKMILIRTNKGFECWVNRRRLTRLR